MKFINTCAIILAVMACASLAWGAPYIGYAYPAGGQQGTVVRIIVGGQRLGNVKEIHISGAGVSASFISFEGAEGPLNGAQRKLLQRAHRGTDR